VVAAEHTMRVDPPAMRSVAQALGEGAEALRNQLTDLDERVVEMLGGWRGASGGAYAAAWELWHRGAGEVEVGLSMLARSIAQAGGAYQDNEAASAGALRAVRRG